MPVAGQINRERERHRNRDTDKAIAGPSYQSAKCSAAALNTVKASDRAERHGRDEQASVVLRFDAVATNFSLVESIRPGRLD